MFLRAVIARVLDDALAHFEGQVQATEGGVALLEVFHDAKSVQVMVEEKAVGAHGCIERLFAGVSERGMAEVVHQGQRFGKIHVEAQRGGDGAGDLRHLDGVSEAVAEMVGVTARENLGLVFEAAEGAGVDDAVAVALEVVAVGMRRLGEAASAGMFHLHRVAGQHFRSLTGASTEYLVPGSAIWGEASADCFYRSLSTISFPISNPRDS